MHTRARTLLALAAALCLTGACNKDRASDADGSSTADTSSATDTAADTAEPTDTHTAEDTSPDTGNSDTTAADTGSDTASDASDDTTASDTTADGDTSPTDDTDDGETGLDGSDGGGDTGDSGDGAVTSDTTTADTTDTSTTNDPFDPASCQGTAWTASKASMRLGSKDSENLDATTVMERSRSCTDTGCTAWSTPQKADIRLLTYSGGVTTRYTTRQVNTTLVLYDDRGSPRLSVRHDTHLNRYPDAHDEGITFGFPPQTEPYPKLKVWNTMPKHSSDYRDLENYLGRDAELFATDHCARFESVLPGRNEDVTHEYVAVYRY